MRIALVIVSGIVMVWLDVAACAAQTIPWARTFGPGRSTSPPVPGEGDRAYSSAVDSNGNIYVTGYFYERVAFPGGTTLNVTSNGDADVFLAKYTSNGTCTWVKNFGGPYWDGGYSVTVDVSDSVCLTGWYSDTVNFNNPGMEPRSLTSRGRDQYVCDIFVAKYDGHGACLWATGMQGTSAVGVDVIDGVEYPWGGSDGVDIAVDASRNIYVTGFFTGTILDPPRPSITSNGKEDVFIAKYNEAGTRLWIKGIGAAQTDHGRSIAVEAGGGAYVAGSFKGSPNFGAPLRSSGDADAFITKYDKDGQHAWSMRMGGSGDDACQALALGPGVLYATGWFQSDADFAGTDPDSRNVTLTSRGSYDAFLAAYNPDDASRSFDWAIGIGGASDDEGYGLATDPRGNVYLAGAFKRTVQFDPTRTITATAGVTGDVTPRYDAFFASYDNGGHFRWVKAVGGTRDDAGRSILALPDPTRRNRIRLDVTGYFAGEDVMFDERGPFSTSGDSDGFLLQFDALRSP